MLFSSIPFLYYFFPFVMLLYFVAPKGFKNLVLFLASLFFYAWGEPKYILLMAVSILVGYLGGIVIGKVKARENARLTKVITALVVVILLGFLAIFKYTDFGISTVNSLLGTEIPLVKLALPIGISFYTFQVMSYVVDVYRGEAKAQYNPFTLATYVSMFPQLIAGPIVRYADVAEQLEHRVHSVDKAALGIRRFVLGLSKKILVANALGELCEIFKASGDKSVVFYWLYAVAFTLHIYYDFSGYSDLAIGLGKIFGLEFMENFNYPYVSKSITEFWRRWHMSLGSWFRDYVYIPLGGNRVPKLRWIFNIFAVWFLTGFWHGASWNFIIWGLYFVFFLLLEKMWLMSYLKKTTIGSHMYVLFFVMISFIIFDAPSMTVAFQNMGGLFGIGVEQTVSNESIYYLKQYGSVIALGIIGSTPLPKLLAEKLQKKMLIGKIVLAARPIILAGLLLVTTAFLVDGSFNPFLYFRF